MLWLLACFAAPTDTGASALRFALPLSEPERYRTVIGVDHDPTVYTGIERLICTSYDGRTFPWCYDEHDGTDYLLEGGFDAMDAGSSTILAAAAGTVIDAHDGEYDRCHGELADGGEVSCDGHEVRANYVVLEHEGGVRTRYWHMQTDSVSVVTGQVVDCGDPLGRVGSSGNSSTPHLHFEVEDADGQPFDPYAGAFSQPESWWVEQGAAEGLPASTCGPGQAYDAQ